MPLHFNLKKDKLNFSGHLLISELHISELPQKFTVTSERARQSMNKTNCVAVIAYKSLTSAVSLTLLVVKGEKKMLPSHNRVHLVMLNAEHDTVYGRHNA